MKTTATPDERINRVARKVSDRGVRLGAPLAEDAVRDFEARHRIVLPDTYRAFLLRVGNGVSTGPPEYGLARLGEVARHMPEDDARVWTQLPHVGQPFPFTKPWVWEDGDASDEGTQADVRHGNIYLGDDGCGMYWFVIV